MVLSALGLNSTQIMHLLYDTSVDKQFATQRN